MRIENQEEYPIKTPLNAKDTVTITDYVTKKTRSATVAEFVGGTILNGDVNVQTDWNEADTNSTAYLKNKPTIVNNVQADWNGTGLATILNKPSLNYSLNKYSLTPTKIGVYSTLLQKTATEVLKDVMRVTAYIDTNEPNQSKGVGVSDTSLYIDMAQYGVVASVVEQVIKTTVVVNHADGNSYVITGTPTTVSYNRNTNKVKINIADINSIAIENSQSAFIIFEYWKK